MLVRCSHKNNYGFNESKIILQCETDVAEMLIMSNTSHTKTARDLVEFINKEYGMTVMQAYDIIAPSIEEASAEMKAVRLARIAMAEKYTKEGK